MSTALATVPAAQPGAITAIKQMSPEQVAVIKQTVAQNATDAELAMFLELANRYQLDPFAREIWCICETKNGQRTTNSDGTMKPAQIMASRDGYLAIANRHPQFDGMESDVVCEGDTFIRKGGQVEHSYGAKRGAIIGAYALVYRKDRTRPAYFFAQWSEYGARNAGNSWSPWSKYASAMNTKVAEAMALKRAFSISGLVTEEEMGMTDAPVGANALALQETASTLPPLADVEGFAARYEAIVEHIRAKGLDAKTVWAEAGVSAQRELDDDEVYRQARSAVGDDPDDDPIDGQAEVVDEPTGDAAVADQIGDEVFSGRDADPDAGGAA